MAAEEKVACLLLPQSEGAKLWLQVVTKRRKRGVQEIFIACSDGLKGFADAIEAGIHLGGGGVVHRAQRPLEAQEKSSC